MNGAVQIEGLDSNSTRMRMHARLNINIICQMHMHLANNIICSSEGNSRFSLVRNEPLRLLIGHLLM
jgi:hypothetical protein